MDDSQNHILCCLCNEPIAPKHNGIAVEIVKLVVSGRVHHVDDIVLTRDAVNQLDKSGLLCINEDTDLEYIYTEDVPKDGIIPEDEFWWEGHSANPVKDGRCCDKCNAKVVMQARFGYIEAMDDEEFEDAGGKTQDGESFKMMKGDWADKTPKDQSKN